MVISALVRSRRRLDYFSVFEPFHQIRGAATDSFRETANVDQRDISFAALDATNITTVEFGF
jgi:hypothetical protein